MNNSYKLNIAGLSRELKLCPINETTSIAAFIMFGDVRLTSACASELLKTAPEYDILITSESKGIPLAFEMARQAKTNNYIVARKMKKLYMSNTLSCEVNSITTAQKQTLYLDEKDVNLLKNKRVLIVDDVISTGDSIRAVEELVIKAGGQVVGRMAVLAEGDAKNRDDIIYLEHLPLFTSDGEPIK